MASRVNKKFVILLSGFLVLTGVGAGGAYYFVKMRSGEHYIAMGDKAMKDGKIDVADKWYERAVGKEQYNVAWLKKWREAREKVVPPQNEYASKYQMLQGILKNLAQSQKTNAQAHAEYLDSILRESQFANARQVYEYLANTAEEALKYFETDPTNPAPAQIRRYRGIALVELMADPTLPKDRIELARQDLEAALKADPSDGDVANSLALWHRFMSDRSKTAGDDSAMKSHLERSREVLAEVIKHPISGSGSTPHPTALIAKLAMEGSDIELTIDTSLSTTEQNKRRMAAMDALAPRVKEVADQLKACAPERINVQQLSRFVMIAPRIDPKNGVALGLDLVDHLLKQKPTDMDLMLIRSQLLSMPPAPGGKPTPAEQQMASYQAIIDLPDLPVSFQGLRLLSTRNRARFAQASMAIQRLTDSSLTAEQKQQALAVAKEKRLDLAKQVSDTAPELQFLDAKLAMLEPDFPRARRLLAEFLKKPGDTGEVAVLEGRLMMADIGMRATPPEPGLARENLMAVLQARPGSLELRMMLAGVERQLQNYSAAAALYRSILQADPDNETVKKELEIVRGVLEGENVSDPVMRVLVAAERAATGTADRLGDSDAAVKILEAGLLEHNQDPRIAIAVAGMKLQSRDTAGARRVLEASLEKRGGETTNDVARMKDMLSRMKAGDSVENAVAFVNQSALSEVDKQLALYRTYSDFGKKDEAEKALAEAERLSPNNVLVVDSRFQQAIQAKDMAKASALADRAAQQNLDQAEGDTFKARLQIAQKNFKEAAATLGRAVERGNATSVVYRLLGLVQAELGRVQDAISSFRRALDLTPTDLPTVKLFISVLVRAGETGEALGVARRAEVIGRNDPEFLNTWLALEANAGRADFARTFREQVRQKNAKDSENLSSLADLYLDAKMWDQAREVIDTLRRDADSLRAAVLDARWHADRGAIDPAKQVLRNYIGTLTDNNAKLEAYLAFGQFLIRRGLSQDGIAALRQAREYQDQKTMNVDVALGDFQLNNGLFEDAERSYRKVVEAGVADPDLAIRKRLIEAMNQQGKFKEAEAEFVALGNDSERDVELMVQRSSVAKGLGDAAKARAILDRAVAKFPEEPLPYLRRARLMMQDQALAKDVQADLATSIRLRPGFWQALRTRAMLAMSEGRTEDGLADLREAVAKNPGNEDLRLELLDYLVRLGRETEAVEVADSALKSRPNDARAMSQYASSFVRGGRWSRAAKYYKMLWQQLQDEASALAYCEALMSSTPPALADAEAVLTTRELKVDRSWRLLMARAIVRKKQSKDAQARDDVLASFEQIGADRVAFMIWVRETGRVYPNLVDRLRILNEVRPPTQLTEWATFARASVAIEDKANTEEGIKALRKLRDQAVDAELRGAIQVTISESFLKDKKWQEGLEEINLGLQFRPNDPVMLNNAAAVLNEFMGKPSEARSFAERACATDPSNPDFADTLADVYWALGDKAQGVRKLGDALRLTQGEVDKCRRSIKLARWRAASGDAAGARYLADSVREMVTDNPSLRDSMKSDYEAMLKEVESAK